MSEKLFALAAQLSKHTPGATTTKTVLGYRWATTSAEAVGNFALSLRDEHPTFSIADLLVIEIPDVAPSPSMGEG